MNNKKKNDANKTPRKKSQQREQAERHGRLQHLAVMWTDAWAVH